jgi:hypothetical protein
VLFVLAVVWFPSHADAQGVAPGLVGGASGFIGGVAVSTGIVTLQARRGIYLSSPSDVIGWETAPIPLGMAAGLWLGLSDAERGRDVLLGGLVGAVTGTAVGVLAGEHLWEDPERRWAGGVIGGAAGLLVGAVAGAALSRGSDEAGVTSIQMRMAVP